jgi:hypothetical protein
MIISQVKLPDCTTYYFYDDCYIFLESTSLYIEYFEDKEIKLIEKLMKGNKENIIIIKQLIKNKQNEL